MIILTEAEIIEAAGRGIERLTTGDQGRGVPAWRVNLRYGMNYHVMSKSEVDQVNATADFKAFVNEEWRSVAAETRQSKTFISCRRNSRLTPDWWRKRRRRQKATGVWQCIPYARTAFGCRSNRGSSRKSISALL